MDDALPLDPVAPPVMPSSCSAVSESVADPIPPLSVAQQLELARAAHVRYRALHNQSENSADDDMAAAIREARDARLLALALDPERADPAWRIDVFEGKAVSHEDLMHFYETYLAAD